jgi:CO/xanthine dehydrogenase Mo-binding subunit
MDGRLWYPSVLASHAALASFLCHKPARILLSREEDFRFTPKKARSVFSLRAALDPSGGVSALEAQIVVNIGAYGPLASEILEQTCFHVTGSLSVPNLKIEGYAVRTNTVPLGAFAGLGAASSFFAAESLANLISRDRGEDPLDWRTRMSCARDPSS